MHSESIARIFVRKLGIKSAAEWRVYCKSGNKPKDIPSNPGESYGIRFKGYGDWLGTGTVHTKEFMSFANAKLFVRRLKLSSKSQWKEYCSSGKKPSGIPVNPPGKYRKEWKGWGDWLGTGYVATYDRKYKPFEEAKRYVHSIRLENGKEWRKYCESKRKPEDIPSTPSRVYKTEWKSLGDWLGTGTIAPQFKKYKSFKEAKEFVHLLGLQSREQWKKYCKSGKKPADIPDYPESSYKKVWIGIGDWLGTGYIAPSKRKYRSFEHARDLVQTLGLKSRKEWIVYYRSGNKPHDILSNPRSVYKSNWKGMGDWLGTGTIANVNKTYRSLEQAREFVRRLGLQSTDQWFDYSKSGRKPADIPSYPDKVYEKDWIDWFDWLGIEGIRWDLNKIKELVRGLIESKAINQWSEAVLYSFLNRRGVLNLAHSNMHRKFLNSMIEASRTEEGLAAINDYVNSDSEIPPDLGVYVQGSQVTDNEKEIESASSEELIKLQSEVDPLHYNDHSTAKQILAATNILESISVDEEAIRFYINYSLGELWKKAFCDEERTVGLDRYDWISRVYT